MKLGSCGGNWVTLQGTGGRPLHAPPPPRNDFSNGVLRKSPVDGGMQAFLPSRFVCGLLPQVLVDQYSFWQHKTTIVGYPLCSKQDPTKATSLLKATLVPKSGGAAGERADSTLACALVKRLELPHVPVDTSGTTGTAPAYPARFDLEPFLSQANAESVELTLLNVLSINFAAAQQQLMQVISRLDLPAHTLVWSKTMPTSPTQGCTVDVIELPRLRLSFTLREHAVRLVREGGVEQQARGPALWCDQHPGLFLSSRGDEEAVASILQGMPHAVLMEDTFGNLFVLASAIAKPILASEANSLKTSASSQQLLSGGAQLDYTDPNWECNLGGVRTYLYPMHGSGGFVTATGLAATLQMFILRFLAGQYTDAFRLVPACFTDQPFTPEEEQLFKQCVP